MPGADGSTWPLSFLLAEHIANTTQRVDQSFLSLNLKLLPQLHHIHFHNISIAPKVIAPDPVKQRLFREHLSRMGYEFLQQLKFQLGQGYLSLSPTDIMTGGIQGEISKAEQGETF